MAIHLHERMHVFNLNDRYEETEKKELDDRNRHRYWHRFITTDKCQSKQLMRRNTILKINSSTEKIIPVMCKLFLLLYDYKNTYLQFYVLRFTN